MQVLTWRVKPKVLDDSQNSPHSGESVVHPSNTRLAIREAIARSGKTHEQIAEALGVVPGTISRWLNGHTDPSFDVLDRLAVALGVPLQLTFGEQQEAPPPQWVTGLPDKVADKVVEELSLAGLMVSEAAIAELAARLGLALQPPDGPVQEESTVPADSGHREPLP